MPLDRLSISDALGSFAPGQALRAAVALSYTFDGHWFEEAVAPILFDRPVTAALVIRDRRALLAEAPSVRYHRADAAFSTRVFHPKLILFVTEDRARAVVGSANLTRGGFERNLELGSVFDLTPEEGSPSFFRELTAYLGSLRREVDGGGRRTLDDVATALKEVIDLAPEPEKEPPHYLLHNYERPLWDQIVERLPHTALRCAAIVSPFYEPDAKPDVTDDPPGQAGDESAFGRLFEVFSFEPDTGERPVAVYFREDFGVTALPVEKLTRWKDRLALHARSPTSTDARPLHGKLLLLEGSRRKGREPFLMAIHGSPNFTAAALLNVPPEGNAELAVMTRLPPRGGLGRIVAALGLSELFIPIVDWSGLRAEPRTVPPPLDQGATTLSDVTYQVVGGTVTITLRNPPPDAKRFRLTALIEGAWTLLAEGDWAGGDTLTVPVTGLLVEDTNSPVRSLQAARVRLQLLGEDASVLAESEAPLNVDRPDQFCGLALVGPLLLTLDQRIAQAGSGVPMTYREQQNWLERLWQASETAPVALPSHQADLDRFFRNLTTGLAGVRRRLEASPRSGFALRNALRQFAAWCGEAVDPEGKIATTECRAFLLDRLGEELHAAIEQAKGQPTPVLDPARDARELGLDAAVAGALTWLDASATPATKTYLGRTRKRFAELRRRLAHSGDSE